jgi:hypothetical protein
LSTIFSEQGRSIAAEAANEKPQDRRGNFGAEIARNPAFVLALARQKCRR